MFKIHELKGHIQSIFIIEYPDKILLTDCATRADFNKITNFIEKKLNRKMQDIKLAVVSHMHPDHAGLANTLQKKYGIPILSHPLAHKWYRGFGGRLQHIIDIFLAWYVSVKQHNPPRRMWHKAVVKADYLYGNTEKLPFFNDWQIIFTPGHTSHDISLYHQHTKTIYLGDVLLKIKNKIVLPMPVTLPALMENTLNQLSEMEINTALLAHGGKVIIEDTNIFFGNTKQMLSNTQKNMPRFVKHLSFFPPCIKNIENC